jgi:hypothetical protein
MTTHARFEFALWHLPGSCRPEPGLIQGTLYPDLGGGTYTLEFLVDEMPCARMEHVTTDGDPVELEIEHECTTGPWNITVRIEHKAAPRSATREQIPQRICLASAR